MTWRMKAWINFLIRDEKCKILILLTVIFIGKPTYFFFVKFNAYSYETTFKFKYLGLMLSLNT